MITTNIRQPAVYAAVGVFCLCVELGIFGILRSTLDTVLANSVAIFFGLLLAFNLNAKYTFKKTDDYFKRLVRYFTVGGFGILLSNILLLEFSEHFEEVFAKLLTLPFYLWFSI